MKHAIVIGGGFTGCTIGYLLEQKGFAVTVLEGSDVLGGGCRTLFYHHHPYTYGPHHLLINADDHQAWDYFNDFLPHRRLEHHVMTYVSQDHRFYTYPPHLDEVETMPDKDQIFAEIENTGRMESVSNFEAYWQKAIGATLYSKFVDAYSRKMWQIDSNRELDEVPRVLKKTTPLRTTTKEYFEGEKIVAYPLAPDGYNSYFDKCLDGCTIHYNSYAKQFDLDKKGVFFDGQWLYGDLLISTTSVDLLFEKAFGELKFMGRDFLKIILPIERITPEPYYFLYYAGDEPYTRIFEYKLLTGHQSRDTMIGVEFPSTKNKLYPFPTKAENLKARHYFDSLPADVYTLGRLGKYRYMDMYTILKDCRELARSL